MDRIAIRWTGRIRESVAGQEALLHVFARVDRLGITTYVLGTPRITLITIAGVVVRIDSGTRAGQLPGVQRVRLREKTPSNDDRFLTVFGKPARIMACECERSSETTLSQAFLLISGDGLNQRLSHSTYLQQLAGSDRTDASIVEQLYWSTLSRAPTSQESQQCIFQLANTANRIQATQDLAWALLNSKEFMFRQ